MFLSQLCYILARWSWASHCLKWGFLHAWNKGNSRTVIWWELLRWWTKMIYSVCVAQSLPTFHYYHQLRTPYLSKSDYVRWEGLPRPVCSLCLAMYLIVVMCKLPALSCTRSSNRKTHSLSSSICHHMRSTTECLTVWMQHILCSNRQWHCSLCQLLGTLFHKFPCRASGQPCGFDEGLSFVSLLDS